MNRSPYATLSAAEWISLRIAESAADSPIPAAHEVLFFSMGLISFATGKRQLTVLGRERLSGDYAVMPTRVAANPFGGRP